METMDSQDEVTADIESLDEEIFAAEDLEIETITKNEIDETTLSDDEHFEASEYQKANDLDLNINYLTDEEGNIDEVLPPTKERNGDEKFVNNQDQAEIDPCNKMLPTGEDSNNQINLETTEASLVLYMIELLQSYPALWFINGYKTKEYEASLVDLCIQFSQKYEYYMTQLELHESLIEIRDWYQKIFKEQSMEELAWPQSEYYEKLTEFLPDTLIGKTCVLCQRLFNDHVQYFAHKQLEHATESPNEDEHEAQTTEEISLMHLKKHVSDYFGARYPLRMGGFSYQCQICSKKYAQSVKATFLEHIKTHLNVRDHVCDICGKAFVKIAKFSVHRKRHFGLHKFKCLICEKEFTNGSLLTAHRKRYHRPLEGTFEQIEEMQRKRQNKRRKVLEDYYNVYKEGNQTHYACSYCERTYKYKHNVYKHCKMSHKDIMFEKGFLKIDESTNDMQSDVELQM